jgi:sec-independent protein translocase protein TatB
MLPSLGFNEIIILGILALVVVGPKDLPLLFRKLGKWTAKLRGMAQEFRTGFDELARQAELDELKREVDALRRTTSLQEIRNEITKPLPTLEDYAGIPSSPAVPAPAPTPALEAPVEPAADVAAEQAADAEETKPVGVPEHADVAPIVRSAP